jgi:hypothetical protein
MSNTPIPWLSSLPVEILHRIFDDIDVPTVLHVEDLKQLLTVMIDMLWIFDLFQSPISKFFVVWLILEKSSH